MLYFLHGLNIRIIIGFLYSPDRRDFLWLFTIIVLIEPTDIFINFNLLFCQKNIFFNITVSFIQGI
jgi:hypothetical protein